MASQRVMIVDNYDATADLLVEILSGEGYTPICCAGEGLDTTAIADARVDLLIVEVGLGSPASTWQLLRDLRQHPSIFALPVIVNSTDDLLLERLAEELHELGCIAVAKPFDMDELLAAIDTCFASGLSEASTSSVERAS